MNCARCHVEFKPGERSVTYPQIGPTGRGDVSGEELQRMRTARYHANENDCIRALGSLVAGHDEWIERLADIIGGLRVEIHALQKKLGLPDTHS